MKVLQHSAMVVFLEIMQLDRVIGTDNLVSRGAYLVKIWIKLHVGNHMEIYSKQHLVAACLAGRWKQRHLTAIKWCAWSWPIRPFGYPC